MAASQDPLPRGSENHSAGIVPLKDNADKSIIPTRKVGEARLGGEMSMWEITLEPHAMMAFKRLFAKINKGEMGKVYLSASEENCQNLRWFSQRYPMRFCMHVGLDERGLSIEDEAMGEHVLHRRADAYDCRLRDVFSIAQGEYIAPQGSMMLPAREYQEQAAAMCLRMSSLLLADSLGLGKAQPVDTKVMTPQGWSRIGDIEPGDFVIGSDGKPTEVLAIHPQGVRPIARVVFSDGSSVLTDKSHLWTMRYRVNGRSFREIHVTTGQLQSGKPFSTRPVNMRTRSGTTISLVTTPLYLPMLASPVEFDVEAVDIGPYTLGILITKGTKEIELGEEVWISVPTEDSLAIKRFITEEGELVDGWESSSISQTCRGRVLGVVDILRDLGLGVKSRSRFIPESYLRASVEDRIALLQGLMDGHGSCSKQGNRLRLDTSSRRLAEDVCALVEGLGGTVKFNQYDRVGDGKNIEYRLGIRLLPTIAPFRLSRRLDLYQPRAKVFPTRRWIRVEDEGEADCVCIEVVASDHLYATEHAILTHNSVSAIRVLAAPETLPALIVCPAHLPSHWVGQLHKFLPHLSTHIICKGQPYPLGLSMPDVSIISYYKMRGWAEVLAGRIKSVVFDECQDLRRKESHKYKSCKYVADEASYRMGLSVGPESPVLLVGGPFQSGWLGSIEMAMERVEVLQGGRSPTGVCDVRSWGIRARGWIGGERTFGWKNVEHFIRHRRGDVPCQVFRVPTGNLTVTEDHDVFIRSRNGFVQARAGNLSAGNLLVGDDGAEWKAFPEMPFKMNDRRFSSGKNTYASQVSWVLSRWAYVLGCFVDTGWVDDDRILMELPSRCVPSVVAQWTEMLLAEGNALFTVTVASDGSHGGRIEVRNRGLADLLRTALGTGIRPEVRRLPMAWVVSWPEREREALLRGLTYAAESGARLGRRRSSDLMGDVMMLALGLGTLSSPADRWLARELEREREVRWRVGVEGGWRNLRIESIMGSSEAMPEVYDLAMEGHPSFVAQHVLVHNSATPIYNMGDEFFNVVDVIRPGALGSQAEFLREWCVADPNSRRDRHVVVDPSALGTHLRETGVMLRRTRKDVGRELPALSRVIYPIEANENVLEKVEGRAIELAKIILSQAKSRAGHGHEKMQAASELSNSLRQATGIAKAPYLADFLQMLVEEKGSPVLCFLWHREVYSIIMERLSSLKPAMYTGSESSTKKDAELKRFLGGGTPLMLMSLRSGSGVDGIQHHCSTVVVGELDWSPGAMEQCLDRETEVLTPQGFLSMEVFLRQSPSHVMGFNLQDSTVQAMPVLHSFSRPLYPGESMFGIDSGRISLRVTGDHRMVVSTVKSKDRHSLRNWTPWRMIHASKLANRVEVSRIPVSGMEFVPPAPLTNMEIRFIAWVLSVGKTLLSRDFALVRKSNYEYLHEMEACLEALNISYEKQELPRIEKPVHHHDLFAYVLHSEGREGKRGLDTWGAWLRSDGALLHALDADQLALFLQIFYWGAGRKLKSRPGGVGTMQLPTSYHLDKRNIPLFSKLQAVCACRGWRTKMNIADFTQVGGDPVFSSSLHVSAGPWRTLTCNVKEGRAKFKKVSTVPGETVWCVSNAWETLIVRRRGCVAVVGNCIGRSHRDGQKEPVFAYYALAESGADPIMSDVLGIKKMQVEGVCNPHAPIVEASLVDPDHIQRLARAYLDRKSSHE